jgi:3-oxosteroid 1-dehydrogenase
MQVSTRLTCDVLVVGSGAGGLLSALRAHDLGLETIVIEKSDRYGGTSAVSGGGIWIPNNDAIKDTDSPELAMSYLRACTKGRVSVERLRAYVDHAPQVHRYLESLGVRYFSVPGYSDYCPSLPGALAGGRTMMPLPFDGRALGDEIFQQREPHPTHKVFNRMQIDLAEMGPLIRRTPGWWRVALKMLLRYWLGDLRFRLRSGRDRRLSTGNAMIAGLRKAMLDRKIPLLLNTGLARIELQRGRVCGAVVVRNGTEHTIEARHGVILAAGGFEKNQALRDRHMPKATPTDYSLSPGLNNSGDALQAATSIGADTEFLDQAWWVATMRVPAPGFNNADMRAALFMERAYPHTVCVNRLGKRFANEAQSYNDFGAAMLEDDRRTGANAPCWMIFDATARYRYPIGALLPPPLWPDWRLPREWFDNVFYRAGTLQELARKIELDPAALAATIERFNGFAASGVDEDFGRGDSAYDRFFGDPRNTPNGTLGAIAKPPFYAMRIDIGDIGTKGGLKTDANANVLGKDGQPIPGLYAAGNVSASITYDSYPGAGATLGPAMTFGYLAAQDIAQHAASDAAPTPRTGEAR